MNAPWILRVASHPRHGGGHLSRMCVLGRALERAKADVLFVLDRDSGPALAQPADAGLVTTVVGSEGAGPWRGCVLDGYDILRDEAEHWRAVAAPVAVIDDFLDPPEGVALVVNGAPHLAGTAIAGVPALLGPDYALIDPRYAALPARDRTAPVLRVLVTFGRLDPDNVTTTVVGALAQISTDLAITVVAPGSSPHLPAIRAALAPFGENGKLLPDPPDLVAPLAGADFVVGAGGVSLLERMAAGVPSMTVSIIENQRLFVQGAVRRGGTIDGGPAAEASVDRIAARLGAILEDGDLRARVAAAGAALIDGRGGERVADRLVRLARGTDTAHHSTAGVA